MQIALLGGTGDIGEALALRPTPAVGMKGDADGLYDNPPSAGSVAELVASADPAGHQRRPLNEEIDHAGARFV